MINKIKSLNNKQWIIITVAFLLIIALIVGACLVFNRHQTDKAKLESIKDVEITEADMREYRERIGSDMDIKSHTLFFSKMKKSAVHLLKLMVQTKILLRQV